MEWPFVGGNPPNSIAERVLVLWHHHIDIITIYAMKYLMVPIAPAVSLVHS